MAGNSSKKTLKIPTLKFEPVILQDQSRCHRRRQIEGDVSGSFRCGVCFSDCRKTPLRGTIDCCNHTFCFVCIVMWSKAKSFCPLCKLHFTTIYGPSKNVVFATKRFVNVPQRSQAYHGLGNATSGLLNPHEGIRCNMCHGTADEIHHRLLCDICDSAVHTYCVGFRGSYVPGAAYFCYDCTFPKSAQDETEVHTAVGNQRTSRNFNAKLPSQRSIVPAFGHHNPSCSSPSNHLSPPFVAGRRTFDEANGPGERWHPLSGPLCVKRSGKGRTQARVRELEKLVQSLRRQIEDEQERRELFERGIQEKIEQQIEGKLQQHLDQVFTIQKQMLLTMHSTVSSSKPPA